MAPSLQNLFSLSSLCFFFLSLMMVPVPQSPLVASKPTLRLYPLLFPSQSSPPCIFHKTPPLPMHCLPLIHSPVNELAHHTPSLSSSEAQADRLLFLASETFAAIDRCLPLDPLHNQILDSVGQLLAHSPSPCFDILVPLVTSSLSFTLQTLWEPKPHHFKLAIRPLLTALKTWQFSNTRFSSTPKILSLHILTHHLSQVYTLFELQSSLNYSQRLAHYANKQLHLLGLFDHDLLPPH